MKKTIAATLMFTVLSGSVFYPRQSHAVVGAFTANPLAMIAGGSIMAAGTILGAVGVANTERLGEEGSIAYFTFAAAAFVMGIIILDEDSGRALKFKELNQNEQKKLELSSAETKLFNSQVSKLNAVAETIDHELSLVDDLRLNNPEKTQLKNEKATALWADYQSEFAPDTLNVVQKIGNRLMQLQHN